MWKIAKNNSSWSRLQASRVFLVCRWRTRRWHMHWRWRRSINVSQNRRSKNICPGCYSKFHSIKVIIIIDFYQSFVISSDHLCDRWASSLGVSDASLKFREFMLMLRKQAVLLIGPQDVWMALMLIILESVIIVPKIGRSRLIATTKLGSATWRTKYF